MNMELLPMLASIVIAVVIAFLLPLKKSKSKGQSHSFGTKFDDWDEVSPNDALKNAKFVPYVDENFTKNKQET